jgi:hypothetical protein
VLACELASKLDSFIISQEIVCNFKTLQLIKKFSEFFSKDCLKLLVKMNRRRRVALITTFLSVVGVVVVVGDNLDLYSSTYEMSRLQLAELKFVEALKTFSESDEKFSDEVQIS